mmetsp:Transcript_21497/g.48836  ORF Transcript_21497/g.48836 Transcript_21497/m.48836 type:complete len:296 (-) Transcript_21497:562-1449(-)
MSQFLQSQEKVCAFRNFHFFPTILTITMIDDSNVNFKLTLTGHRFYMRCLESARSSVQIFLQHVLLPILIERNQLPKIPYTVSFQLQHAVQQKNSPAPQDQYDGEELRPRLPGAAHVVRLPPELRIYDDVGQARYHPSHRGRRLGFEKRLYYFALGGLNFVTHAEGGHGGQGPPGPHGDVDRGLGAVPQPQGVDEGGVVGEVVDQDGEGGGQGNVLPGQAAVVVAGVLAPPVDGSHSEVGKDQADGDGSETSQDGGGEGGVVDHPQVELFPGPGSEIGGDQQEGQYDSDVVEGLF